MWFIFLIPIITTAGTPRYIPRFNAITEIPNIQPKVFVTTNNFEY